VTADGKRSAQFEHTVIVTREGCEVTTLLLDQDQAWDDVSTDT